MRSIFALAAATLLATSAVCQGLIVLPTPTLIYTGNSRGFSFTAPASFRISGLDLSSLNQQAGDTASYGVWVNGTRVIYSTGNAGAISANQLVQTGDVVIVIGNWSLPVPTSTSAHVAYAPGGGTYQTQIMGTSTTLYRASYLGDIAYNGGLNTPSGGLSGNMGYVEVTTLPATGIFAGFTADVQSGPSPLTVNFTDTTSTSDPAGVQTWSWDFDNDGAIDSTIQNPTHTYTNCGTYDVSLTVTDTMNPPGTKLETGYIVTDRVSADFTYSGVVPLVVQFADASTGSPTAWDWDLDGDGVTDSNAQNPVWVYLSSAPVTVSLTVSRLCGPADTIQQLVVPGPSISHNLAPTTGLSSGGMVFFDLDVTAPDGLFLDSIESMHSSYNTAYNLDLWVRQGAFDGFEKAPAEWTLAGTATGTTGPSSASTSIASFATPVYLPPGLHGIALQTDGVGFRYKTGSTAVGYETVTNADLSLIVGKSLSCPVGSPFVTGSNPYLPRLFSGSIYYSTHAMTGAAGVGVFGAGCTGSLGISGLSYSGAPVLGTTMTVTIDNLPVDTAILMNAFNNQSWPLGALPYDVTSLGAAGCFLRVDPLMNVFLLGSAGSAAWSLTIPNAPSLMGKPLFQQALIFDPGFNAAGAVGSNAYGLLFGN